MQGHIRTNQKCPMCKGSFSKTGNKLTCSNCLTYPTRFFVDITYNKKRIKIYKDESGQVLDSHERALRLLNAIRWQIDNVAFDPNKYQKVKYEQFLFERYANNWLREQEIRFNANEIAGGTFIKNKRVINQFLIPHFGQKDIRTVTTRDVKDFSLKLAETIVKGGKLMSPKYREFIVGLLRNIFLDGLRSGDLNRAQVPMFPVIEIPDKPFKFLTESEQDEIMGFIPSHDRPLYHMILTYGIRPSEVRAIKRDSIIGDFEHLTIRRTFTRNNQLRDNPKENRWRVIPLNDDTRVIMKSLKKSLTGFIFVNKWGRHYCQDYVNRTWNKACEKAGYGYIRLYNASRHSLGTKLANKGFGKDQIALALGHRGTKNTDKYVRVATNSLKPFYQREKIKKTRVRRLSVGKNN